jgi:multidrug efflux pump subunit AcrA (membrane-fusion protein)
MSLRLLHSSIVLAVAGLLLAGCSHSDAPQTSTQAATPAYAAIARGRIDIEGGLLKLNMPRDGVVAEIKVHEGDQVHKGQLLAVLDTESAHLAVSSAEAEQKQAEAQATQLETRLKATEQRAQRIAAAAAAGAADGQSADDARAAAQQLQGELDNTRAAAASAARKLTAARYELTQRSLNAPVDAEIIRRSIQPGATVSPQSGPAFVLLPNQPRIVRAELNESFVGAVHDGMSAEVIDDSGSGAPPLNARVLRIGEVFGTSSLEEDPLVRANSRTVECVLVFDQPPPATLRIGQRVIVRFSGKDVSKDGKAAN